MQGSNKRLYQQFFYLNMHDLTKFADASCWRYTAVFNSNTLDNFISFYKHRFFKRIIRTKKQKIAVNNAITDIL